VSDAPAMEFLPGRFGRNVPTPGLLVREYTDFALASVLALRGRESEVVLAVEHAFGTRPPTKPSAVSGHDIAFIWSGPASWLALAESSADGIEATLAAPLGGLASICDQSDSRVMLELHGSRVREVLAKGAALDLHPRVFRSGDTALTSIGHVGVQLWQTSETPGYRLLVTRSYFGSFWRWLAASAAEYGGELLAAQRYCAR
jgi:heterotetrameric sarcosine oxidase gamma subunit